MPFGDEVVIISPRSGGLGHNDLFSFTFSQWRKVPVTMIYETFSHYFVSSVIASKQFQNLYLSPNDCKFCWCRKLEWRVFPNVPVWSQWSVAEFKRLPKPYAFFTKCWFQQPTLTWIAVAPPFSKVSAGKVLAVGVVASLCLLAKISGISVLGSPS